MSNHGSGHVARIAVAATMALASVWLPVTAGAQSAQVYKLEPELFHAYNVDIQQVEFKGAMALKARALTVPPDPTHEALIVIADSDFHDGTIELQMAGDLAPDADAQARGFVGIAFRADAAAQAFELFYLRPTNGRADDQLRRNHALQYVSSPDFTWQRLRSESPGQYESYADLQPGTWTTVRIEVTGTKARMYINGAEQPALLVNDLKRGDASGNVALWVGPGTVAHFRDLKITRR